MMCPCGHHELGREDMRRIAGKAARVSNSRRAVDAELPESFPARALLLEQAGRVETARERSRGETGYVWPGAPRVRREAAWLEALLCRALGYGRSTWGPLVRKAREAEADIRAELAALNEERRA